MRPLRLVLRDATGDRTVEVEGVALETTLGDVLAAADVTAGPTVWVDDRAVGIDHGLAEAGVVDGARLALLPPAGRARPGLDRAPAAARLEVVAGADTGHAAPLVGPLSIGRDPASGLRLTSATVSRAQCRVRPVADGGLVVEDAGSVNGTWHAGTPVGGAGHTVALGEVLRAGATALRPVPPSLVGGAPGGDAPPPVRGGRRTFDRPPRPAPPAGAPPVHVPPARASVGAVPPLPIVAALVPAVLGLVLVLTTGGWRSGVFLLLSPVVLLAGGLSGRRRHRHDLRRAQRDHDRALAVFAARVAAAAAAERTARWERHPSLPTLVRRAVDVEPRLWERRAGDDDALVLAVGVGTERWTPALVDGTGRDAGTPTGDVARVLDGHTELRDVPVPLDLGAGGVVGVVGPPTVTRAIARSLLLQATVLHGPADLDVAVLAATVGAWDWATWLPHLRAASGEDRLADGVAESHVLAAALRAGGRRTGDRTLLAVLDGAALTSGRDADARAVLRGAGGPVAGIVLATSVEQLPAVCSRVVTCTDEDGTVDVTRPSEVVRGVLAAQLDVATCADVARRLAGLEDAELSRTASLPARVRLLDLVVHDATDAAAVATSWAGTAGDAALSTPIGVGPDGPVMLDLTGDGPHALVAGTTGAGKSELLRSLVAGLAAQHGPDDVTFVLVDYKGGAAFDACAGLPHVVGLVTDLDDHLGDRALRCLEAELLHRERRLRDAGVADLTALRRQPHHEPLPRLVVVVDEFATLRAELPAFVAALLDIAQRGRSLGVHLVLGTQRPAGAVDDAIRANVALRVALRTTSAADANDVVGVPDAAGFPADRPGRAVVRVAGAQPLTMQTAFVSGRPVDGDGLRVTPLRGRAAAPPAPTPTADARTDLERLVAACVAAHAASGAAPPRRPWTEPLPGRLAWDELSAVADDPAEDAQRGATDAPVLLVDDPDGQRRVVRGWDTRRGTLVLGGPGSGTTTTLAALTLAAVRDVPRAALHVHVLDADGGGLAPLEDLPHCGGVVPLGDEERTARLLAWWRAEVERRRSLAPDERAAQPDHLLVVDGLDVLLAELAAPGRHDEHDMLVRLLAESAGVGMAVLAAAAAPGALRHAVLRALPDRLVHQLVDPSELGAVGVATRDVPPLPPGRVLLPDGRLGQVADPGPLAARVSAAAAARPATVAGEPAPRPIRRLPRRVPPASLVPAVRTGAGVLHLPVGTDDILLAPAGVPLHAGEHLVVLGPPGSGRVELLGGLAGVWEEAGLDVVRLTGGAGLDLAHELRTVAVRATQDRPVVVVLTEADAVPDPGAALTEAGECGVHLVVAVRQTTLELDFGHWVRRLTRAGTGVVLGDQAQAGADLLGARLPRRTLAPPAPGRGWAVERGRARFVQTMTG